MVRYYKTPDGQALRVSREMVDFPSIVTAVKVTILFGKVLYTTESRVQEDEFEGDRLDNAVNAALAGDHDVMVEYLEEDEAQFDHLFDEAEDWIMKEYPGAVRDHELEADLEGM